MARPKTIYACTACGAQQPRWHGRCPDCGAWESLVEEAAPSPKATAASASEGLQTRARGRGRAAYARPDASPDGKLRRLGEIDPDAAPRIDTGIPELNRVLGGGLVPGGVVLLGGEPGVGKSTLALQLANALARRGQSVLYVSGEESGEQIRLRAERLPDMTGDIHVLSETRVEALAEPWAVLSPRLVLIDSIQTARCDRVESAAGSVAQVRECAALLAATAKREGTAAILVGHVTKEGTLAGPRVLEHLVDVVLNFEGDRAHAFRLLRASKNRFGSTQEVGVFSMTGAGLEGVENPSELFLAERTSEAPGTCVVPLLEGTRPMLVELQALVAPAPYGTPRRTTLGVEDGRVALLLAVLDRRSAVDLLSQDVYVNAAGGVRVAEPSADLAIALAIASSRLDVAVPNDVAACGEIGLGGEVRRVGRLDLRVREAARLGFRRMLVPAGTDPAVARGVDCELVPIVNVGDAVAWLQG